MKTSPRLKLKESYHTFLEKAKVHAIHLSEDWDEISQVAPQSDLITLYQKVIKNAEESLGIHSTCWRSDTPMKKNKRLMLLEARELYQEMRQCFIYLAPRKFNMKEILALNPFKPKNIDLPFCIANFHEAFLSLPTRPPYITDELLESAKETRKELANMLSVDNVYKGDQVTLREQRDEAFRELRDLQILVKEAGKFTFRNNPTMKQRYK